jgi:hypothetical protein
MSTPTIVKQHEKATRLSKLESAKCLPHFEKGIATCGALAKGMSLLMADLLSERVSTSVANSVCNSAGKMLKAVEMQQRFGKTVAQSGEKELNLVS